MPVEEAVDFLKPHRNHNKTTSELECTLKRKFGSHSRITALTQPVKVADLRF